MRGLFHLALRFRRDDRGAFAVIFAVIAIVLIAMSGATVDFTVLQEARTKGQAALDAAALALQPGIFATPLASAQTSIQNQAQALLIDRLADAATKWGNCHTNGNNAPCAYVQAPTIDTGNGQLALVATLKVPMTFVSLVGVTSMSPTLLSVATQKKLKLEVGMVLDNSASMTSAMGTSTRILTLQASAACAANILFYGVTKCDAATSDRAVNSNVKIGVVPFASVVNVGASNASAKWLDRAGPNNAITRMHFDDDDNPSTPFTGTVDRIALFPTISYGGTALSWAGCVEARVNNGSDEQYDTDDTAPDTSRPDTLFTPYFAPDEPGGSNDAEYGWWAYDGYFINSYIPDGCSGRNDTATTSRPYQERLCKYSSSTAIMKYPPSPRAVYGPNGDCPSPITPLTSSPSTVLAAINALAPTGNTDIQEGVAWGFRVLSPTPPFIEGASYAASVSKAMIVMTDGENTMSGYNWSFNGAMRYSAYGYPADGRLGTTSIDNYVLDSQINARLATTCTNAKAQGIVVYVIGVATGDTSNPAGNKALLTNCASTPGDAYFPNSPDDLQSAFVAIATQLAALRLSR